MHAQKPLVAVFQVNHTLCLKKGTPTLSVVTLKEINRFWRKIHNTTLYCPRSVATDSSWLQSLKWRFSRQPTVLWWRIRKFITPSSETQCIIKIIIIALIKNWNWNWVYFWDQNITFGGCIVVCICVCICVCISIYLYVCLYVYLYVCLCVFRVIVLTVCSLLKTVKSESLWDNRSVLPSV